MNDEIPNTVPPEFEPGEGDVVERLLDALLSKARPLHKSILDLITLIADQQIDMLRGEDGTAKLSGWTIPADEIERAKIGVGIMISAGIKFTPDLEIDSTTELETMDGRDVSWIRAMTIAIFRTIITEAMNRHEALTEYISETVEPVVDRADALIALALERLGGRSLTIDQDSYNEKMKRQFRTIYCRLGETNDLFIGSMSVREADMDMRCALCHEPAYIFCELDDDSEKILKRKVNGALCREHEREPVPTKPLG